MAVDNRTRAPIPRRVWLLSWVSFLADVSGEMTYPLLPLFLVNVLGASRSALGAVEGVAVVIVSLMGAAAGWHSDRSGRRVPWIRLGYGLPVLGKAIIAAAGSWWVVLGGRSLDRFGKGLRGSPRDALIADSVEDGDRGRAFGVHRAFDTAGALAGVLLAAVLLWWLAGTPRPGSGGEAGGTAWVYRAIFAVAAALGLGSLGLTFLLREPAGQERASEPPGGAIARRGLPREYWWVLGVLGVFSLGNSSDTFLLLRASEVGFSAWTVVLAYAVFNVSYAAVSYPAGVLSDAAGRWRVIAAGWAVYAAVYAGFAFLTPGAGWGVWVLMLAYGAYMGLTEGVNKALIADCVPRERRATAMGLYYGVTGLTALASSVAAGAVWDRFGARPAFLMGSGFAVLALLVLAVHRLARGRGRR